jgi:hypothetical protein
LALPPEDLIAHSTVLVCSRLQLTVTLAMNRLIIADELPPAMLAGATLIVVANMLAPRKQRSAAESCRDSRQGSLTQRRYGAKERGRRKHNCSMPLLTRPPNGDILRSRSGSMQIELSDQTIRDVQALLAKRGEGVDVSAFVNQTLQRAVFFETVREVKRQNEGVDSLELDRLIDEAVADARSELRGPTSHANGA